MKQSLRARHAEKEAVKARKASFGYLDGLTSTASASSSGSGASSSLPVGGLVQGTLDKLVRPTKTAAVRTDTRNQLRYTRVLNLLRCIVYVVRSILQCLACAMLTVPDVVLPASDKSEIFLSSSLSSLRLMRRSPRSSMRTA